MAAIIAPMIRAAVGTVRLVLFVRTLAALTSVAPTTIAATLVAAAVRFVSPGLSLVYSATSGEVAAASRTAARTCSTAVQ